MIGKRCDGAVEAHGLPSSLPAPAIQCAEGGGGDSLCEVRRRTRGHLHATGLQVGTCTLHTPRYLHTASQPHLDGCQQPPVLVRLQPHSGEAVDGGARLARPRLRLLLHDALVLVARDRHALLRAGRSWQTALWGRAADGQAWRGRSVH